MVLNVERYGAGEPIIFIHGVGGSTQYWYFQREYLKSIMEVSLSTFLATGNQAVKVARQLKKPGIQYGMLY
jgi:pimeloyl-ACP methyl ester carboxylesterase